MIAEDSEVAVPTLSLGDFIQVLRRRQKTALITLGAVVALTMLATLLTKPQYISNARLMLEDQAASSGPSLPGELSSLFPTKGGLAIASQVQLIGSPLILNEVYEKSKVPPESVELTVSRVENTNVIQIAGISRSPVYAQNFVAAVPEVYQENRRNESSREVMSELEFAQRDLAQESQKLKDSEQAIVDFKNRNGLINPESEATEAVTRAANKKAALADARAEISSLRAQIQALEAQLETLPPTVDSPTVSTNPKVQDLKNQLAELQSERKEKSFLYKPNADPIRQIDLQIATLKAQIASTPPTITQNSRSLNPDVASTRSRIAGLRADLSAKEASAKILAAQSAKLDAGLNRYSDIQRTQAQLQRDFEATQTAVQEGQTKVRALGLRVKALQAAGAPITVLLKGTPGLKIAPKPGRNLIIGIFLGALLACVAALIQDSLDDRIRDEEEVRQLAGAPVLGYFPLLPVSDERPILDVNHPDRLILETFRSLRSNVQFALVGSHGKKLLISSAVPNEGKSYIASNLAITMALDGKRVILVDADLHRPTMHERFASPRQPGLTNVLIGENTVEEALQKTAFENLRLIAAGALPPNPAELLNSPTMTTMLEQLEASADLIIFDSPPLLATSDSQLMSAKMDGVIFVMQMGSVARSGTLRSFELLQQAHANVVGVVFNKVDEDKNAASYSNYGGHYTLDASASNGEVLIAPANPLPAGVATSNGHGQHPDGLSKNDGSTRSKTVFDEALHSKENSA